jgi:nucleoid-associated protein Lsr2
MSTKTVLVDDLDDRTEGAETIRYYWRGWYEIDVSAKHLADMDKAFSVYVNSSRKLTGAPAAILGKPKRAAGGRDRSAAARATSAEIRSWAKANGIEINNRGRIPDNVITRYEASGQGGRALRSAG